MLGVFSAADVAELPRIAHTLPMLPDGMRRPLLATDVVRFVGEPVAVVVAEDRYVAADAADLVVVDYEPLTPAVDPESAATDTVVLFPEVGTNSALRLASPQRADFSGCEVVVELRVENQRMTAAPIEPRSGAAYWTEDGRLVHYSACQGAHPAREALCAIYGLPPEGIRVVVPDVGGGFGAKSRCQAEELLLGWLSRRVGRAGPLDRDPLGEHGRHAPRSGPAAARHDRRHPRRSHHRLPARRRAGRGCLPDRSGRSCPP